MTLPVGVSLQSATDTLNLTAWMEPATRHRVMKGLRGFGMPPVAQQWAEGAGDGAQLISERVLPREVTVPLSIVAADRALVRDQYNRLARMLAPGVKPRLVVTEPTGAIWETVVSRAGGGDYDWGTMTNGRTVVTTEVLLRAGDPYWTAREPLIVSLAAGATGRGLLPDLAELALVSTLAEGVASIENPGSAPALAVWELEGPVEQFTATGPAGDVLEWDGALDAVYGVLVEGETLTLDGRNGTVVDNLGQNRFRGMGTAPRFWTLPAGTSTIEVAAVGTDANSAVRLKFYPRQWVVF